jgi:hypothetical protein
VRTRRRRFGPLAAGALALAGAAILAASAGPIARAGTGPGSTFWGEWDLSENTGNGDNILRLVNPSGSANPEIAPVTNMCAMIYVFDDDQEMGECCGCPITPAQLATFSFEQDLVNNWGIQSPHGEGIDNNSGAIAIHSSAINQGPFGNTPACINPVSGEPSFACHGGCDPATGYIDNPTLLGSITHPQLIPNFTTTKLTEVELFHDGAGDQTNKTYLIKECASLVGNGSGGAICSCPNDDTVD